MKLKQIGKLFPDLKDYNVNVYNKEKCYSVEDLKQHPSILDRDIKEIKFKGYKFLKKPIMEIYL